MPNLTLVRSHLFDAIGRTYTDVEFDELCFEFGVEVDDVSTEIVEFTGDGSKEEQVVYIIAIPANRYDLLCMEGFSRALRIFIGLESCPIYQLVEPTEEKRLTMHVESSTNQIRPFVVCAVLRGITFDKRRYKSFIDLQEKLHQNICRKRTYVAIGTHDLDTISNPFNYQALEPNLINFVPLTENNNKSYEGKELLNYYRENSSVKHLKSYTDIIYDSPVYPIIYDNNHNVLSMPPIINSKHSRIQMKTKNIFIECTGTDLTKANIVLDTIVTMFSEYCEIPFTIEPVTIIYKETGIMHKTPLLSHRSCDATIKDIHGIIGVNINPLEICKLCDRMQLGPSQYLEASSCEAVTSGGVGEVILENMIRVQVPPTRSDILHAVDIIEDIAIAYGYNNIPLVIPSTQCFGAPLPINQFCDLLRAEIARAGYMEMLTHGLCSTAENFTYLRRPIDAAVTLSNPANVEYEVVRTTLMPGALKTLSYNKSLSHKDGIKLFEISDVVIPTNNNEIGARNVRKIVALYSSYTAGFEIIHGLVDKIMTCIQIKPEKNYASNSLTKDEYNDLERVSRNDIVYTIQSCNDSCYFNGMSANIILQTLSSSSNQVLSEKIVGTIGVVHPEVLQNFDVSYPCSILEMDVEGIM